MVDPTTFDSVKIYVPLGSLGVGVQAKDIEAALALGPEAMAMDAGSTDSGAAYLAKGVPKYSRGAIKRDLKLLMAAREKANIPMLIGTCGQAGGDGNVQATLEVVLEVAREEGYAPKIACLYSEQSPQLIKQKLGEGKVTPLPPLGDLTDETIDSCLHIVALMGPEPYWAALEAGADIILGGRSSDPAVIAAFALWKGAPAGPAWHAGKVSECGAQASVGGSGDKGVFIELDRDGFNIRTLDPRLKATTETISAHLLYENKDPWRLTEPGGELDVTESVYEQLSETTVRVTGSVWHPKPYTMKLEGASGNLFQTLMLIGIVDPEVLAQPKVFHDKMLHHLKARVKSTTQLTEDEFHISLRMYGWNGVSGVDPPEGTAAPRELGVLCVMTARSQELANQMAKACNAYFFHMPIRDGIELPTYGFPFTPADVDRGPVYQFVLNHVVHIDSPTELVRTEYIDLSANHDKVTVDA